MGTGKALLIGVERYRSTQIPGVDYARSDAEAFAAALETTGVLPGDVVCLVDDAATKAAIDSKIAGLANWLDPDDRFFLFFAGHGMTDGAANYLVCWDTIVSDPTHTALRLQTVFEAVSTSGCRQTALFLDACHSGLTISSSRGAFTGLSQAELENYFASAEHAACFSACKTDETSWSSAALEHGIWTYHVLRAFTGQAAEAQDGGTSLVTQSSLQTYLARTVPPLVRQHVSPTAKQTPWFCGQMTGNFILADLAPSLARPRPHVITTADRALALTEGVYDMVAGHMHVSADFRDVAYALGWDQKDALSALKHAAGQGHIRHSGGGSGVVLEPAGIDAVEEARDVPELLQTQARGLLFLTMAYVQAGGQSRRLHSVPLVAGALGWCDSETTTVHSYLAEGGMFDRQAIGGLFALSPCAVGRVEAFLQELVASPGATTVEGLASLAEQPLRDLARQQALARDSLARAAVQLHMRLLQAAVDQYRQDLGELPSDLADLTAKRPSAPHGRYLCRLPEHPAGGCYKLDLETGQVRETDEESDAS